MVPDGPKLPFSTLLASDEKGDEGTEREEGSFNCAFSFLDGAKMNSNADRTSFLQPAEPDRPFLLAADIDGTLVGDEEGEVFLRRFAADHSDDFYLAVISGRSLESIMQLIGEGRLPKPDYIGSSVGTELLCLDDAANAMGARYAAQAPSGWNLEAIYALGEGEGIKRQDFPEGQPRFHAGFFWDGRPENLAALRSRLSGCEDCNIFPSYGQYVDVLPARIGKGGMVRFLQQELNLDPARIVVAGDSGNDREMFETGFRGVVPVNGLDELKDASREKWHYHSPLPAARGVLDGLAHFGLIKRGG